MEELIQRSLDGNQEAYIELIENIKVEMYKIASSQLRNIDDVNDAIQETIINSYTKLHTLKNPSYFKTWIIRILINECNHIYRKRKRQLGLFDKLSHSVDISISTEEEIQDKENDIDFDLLIQHLNYDERLILTLYYKNNYTPTEISDILSVNINTVKSKLLRTKQKLQKLFDEGGMNDGKQK